MRFLLSTLRSMTLAVLSTLLVATADLRHPVLAEARTYRCNGQEATIVGTRGDDVIEGTDADDVIVTFAGDDVIFSGAGDDLICAGSGDDVVFSGAGNDWVSLQGGDDFAYGGPGDDLLRGGTGDDVLEGGPGTTRARGQNGNDELWGTWCTPPRTMQHYCRWPDLTVYPDEYADLLEGTRTLRHGSSGEDVRQLQALLSSLDYAPGPIDGSFGAATAAAVRAFQEVSDLESDGVVGPSTRAALQEAVGSVDSPEMPDDWILGKAGVLKSGSRGEAVAALQRTLIGLGYDPGPADGILGSGTVAAIRSFQERQRPRRRWEGRGWRQAGSVRRYRRSEGSAGRQGLRRLQFRHAQTWVRRPPRSEVWCPVGRDSRRGMAPPHHRGLHRMGPRRGDRSGRRRCCV